MTNAARIPLYYKPRLSQQNARFLLWLLKALQTNPHSSPLQHFYQGMSVVLHYSGSVGDQGLSLLIPPKDWRGRTFSTQAQGSALPKPKATQKDAFDEDPQAPKLNSPPLAPLKNAPKDQGHSSDPKPLEPD